MVLDILRAIGVSQRVQRFVVVVIRRTDVGNLVFRLHTERSRIVNSPWPSWSCRPASLAADG